MTNQQKFEQVRAKANALGFELRCIGGETEIVCFNIEQAEAALDNIARGGRAPPAPEESMPKPFDIKTDVTLECPYCGDYKTVPRTPDLPPEVRLIEIICPDCDDGDRHTETWFSAPGIEVSQDRCERKRK